MGNVFSLNVVGAFLLLFSFFLLKFGKREGLSLFHYYNNKEMFSLLIVVGAFLLLVTHDI